MPSWMDWIIPALLGAGVGAAAAGGLGGGEETQTLQLLSTPRTPEEEELLAAQLEFLDLQMQAVQRENDALATVFPGQVQLLDAQTQAALLQVDAFSRTIAGLTPTADEEEIRRLSSQKALAILRGEAPQLAEAQRANLETIYGTATRRGTEELTRYGEEIAAARGMRLTDSPIADELLRQKAALTENLGAARAASELNYGQAQQAFDESVRQFQEDLRARAFQSRLALLGTPPSTTSPIFGSGLPTAAFSSATPLVDVLGGQRQIGRTQTTGFNPGGFNYFSALTGAASLPLYGLAMRK